MGYILLANIQKSAIKILIIKDGKTLFLGFVTLKRSQKGPRVARYRIERDHEEQLRQPQEAVELLRGADNILIASTGSDDSEFREMLSAFKLSAEKVKVCRFCLIEDRSTPLTQSLISYRGEQICEYCAKKELRRETAFEGRFKGVAEKRLEEILMKTRDLDRTLQLLYPMKLDPALTRFDVIPSTAKALAMPVVDLNIPEAMKEVIKVKHLLPVQSLAVKAGLLEHRNLLVVSATATGKTLIAELGGINNLFLNKGKMIYLVPLVALANQKYDQFNKRYSRLGLKTALRIGVSRIKTPEWRDIPSSLDADIIVGTYEGFDYLLRAGRKKDLDRIGTVVIDEVHMVEDPERGHRLDGLIARLRRVAGDAQFIFLSATLGGAKKLGEHLNAALVEYEHRPIPIERHLIFALEHEKIRLIDSLAKAEYSKRSSKGYLGQTIVFTNSRKNCHAVAGQLFLPSAAYHAGLPLHERQRIEERFARGEIAVVVTTAALSAGVDFPASQVIFESLAMGIEWLRVQEFHQMLGRAGRPDYHDLGKVVLLATPDRRYGGSSQESEDEIALRLLREGFEAINVSYEEQEQMEEVLANAALCTSEEELISLNESLICDFDSRITMRKLREFGLLEKDGVKLTALGKIACENFLSPEQVFQIIAILKKGLPATEIATTLSAFDQLYINDIDRINITLNLNLSSKLFNSASLEVLFQGDSMAKLNENTRKPLIKFAKDFLNCRCRAHPYCLCPEKKFSAHLIKLRTQGLDPRGIAGEISSEYGVHAYSGDIYSYLDQTARRLEAIEAIAKLSGEGAVAIDARLLRTGIEEGKKK